MAENKSETKEERKRLREEAQRQRMLIRWEKQKQAEIRIFHRRLLLKKNAGVQEINAKVLAYAKRTRDVGTIKLTDEQYADSDFMYSLYLANADTARRFKPIQSHYDNIDFLIKWLKISYENRGAESNKLKWILINHEGMLKNPKFVERLIREFPQENIIELLRDRLVDTSFVAKDEEREKTFVTIIMQLPKESVALQAWMHGRLVLRKLPKTYPYMAEAVSKGIETDGFCSLRYLDVTQIAQNIDLIVKAYNKDGIKELYRYLKSDLSPSRTGYYMCHGEPHDYSYYDERYEVVQKLVMKDPRIVKILNQHQQNSLIDRITKSQPATYDVDNMTFRPKSTEKPNTTDEDGGHTSN